MAEELYRKSFDFAADATKQLIALATGILTITIALSKVISDTINPDNYCWIFWAWIAFLCSIVFGIVTLQALTGKLAQMAAASGTTQDKGINEKSVRIPSLCQVILFIVGMVLSVIFGSSVLSQNASSSTKTEPLTPTIIHSTEYRIESSPAPVDTLDLLPSDTRRNESE